MNQKDSAVDGFKGAVPSLSSKKMAEPNPVIMVVFLIALGL